MRIDLTSEEFYLLLDLLGESANWREVKEWYRPDQQDQLKALYDRLTETFVLGIQNP